MSGTDTARKYHIAPRTAKRYAESPQWPEYTLTVPKSTSWPVQQVDQCGPAGENRCPAPEAYLTGKEIPRRGCKQVFQRYVHPRPKQWHHRRNQDLFLVMMEAQTQKIQLLIENKVTQKIKLIFDKLDGIDQKLEAMPAAEDWAISNGGIEVVEAIVKKLSRDAATLKKAH